MYVEVVPNRSSPPAILSREGWREGSRVRKRTPRQSLQLAPGQDRRPSASCSKTSPSLAPTKLSSIVSSRPHGHVELVLEAFRRLSLPKLLDRASSPQRSAVLAMIAQRLLHPGLQARHHPPLARHPPWPKNSTCSTTPTKMPSTRPWTGCLSARTASSNASPKRHLQDDAQVLYDVSSSYYEGHSCPLMR